MDRVKGLELTGAEIVVRCLQEEGVEYVFGYPGGAVLPLDAQEASYLAASARIASLRWVLGCDTVSIYSKFRESCIYSQPFPVSSRDIDCYFIDS